jgi:hypothetical protein
MIRPRTLGAFHQYVRSVFADSSVRARLLRAGRASWLHKLSRLPAMQIRATNLYSRD